MKKIKSARLCTWALVVALPLWIGSCKKDSNEAVTPTGSSIQGSWRVTGYKIDPGVDFLKTGQKSTDLLAFLQSLPNGLGTDAIACLTQSTITFNSNGKVTAQSSSKCNSSTDGFNPVDDNSTWKLDGNKLTITDSSGSQVYDTVISGNTLKMSQTAMDDYGDGQKNYTTTIELSKQ